LAEVIAKTLSDAAVDRRTPMVHFLDAGTAGAGERLRPSRAERLAWNRAPLYRYVESVGRSKLTPPSSTSVKSRPPAATGTPQQAAGDGAALRADAPERHDHFLSPAARHRSGNPRQDVDAGSARGLHGGGLEKVSTYIATAMSSSRPQIGGKSAMSGRPARLRPRQRCRDPRASWLAAIIAADRSRGAAARDALAVCFLSPRRTRRARRNSNGIRPGAADIRLRSRPLHHYPAASPLEAVPGVVDPARHVMTAETEHGAEIARSVQS